MSKSHVYEGHIEGPIYVSGPMSGYPDQNYPAFHAVTNTLRGLGKTVYNPAENFGGQLGLSRKEYMRIDLGHVLQARSLVVLQGWVNSPGACLEVDVARELGLSLYYHDKGDLFRPFNGENTEDDDHHDIGGEG